MDLSFCTPCNGSSSSKQFHVLMFPWLAQGQISAYAELSKRIADQGVQVSFLTTPLNIPRIKPMIASHERIQLLAMPLPAVEGLPKGIECTSDTPPHLWGHLLRAVHLLEKPFERLLHSIEPPDCIVFDIVQYWTPTVAAKFGIPTVFFLTFGATYCSYEMSPHRVKNQEKITAEDLTKPPPGYPSPAISQRLFEACVSLNIYYVRDDSSNGMTGIDRTMACIEGCNAIAIKSCNELEGKFIEYFERVTAKPVLPVGPLLLSMQEGHSEADSDCLEWLEKQQRGSVVYVAFGSECFLPEQQIQEVALGLEAAQHPFILVVRMQNNTPFVFPEGYERRIDKRGFVVNGWAPQKEILCHSSTGAFVTHCGWNSLMEGMSNGLPLIALPMLYDQGLNARLIVEELKVGVEVERENDGFAKSEEICKAVRRVMVEEEGKKFKKAAWEMGNVFRTCMNNGSQKSCIDKFVEHLARLIV